MVLVKTAESIWRKEEIDGIRFDSKREAKRYQELKLLEQQGYISELERQVTFELIPSQRLNNGFVIERPVKYVADFSYVDGGGRVIEDVKSPATKTPQYIIKRKLMLWRFGIRVREV